MKFVRFKDEAGFVRTGNWTDSGIESAGKVYNPDKVEILPPTTPTKIICLSGNYKKHLEESGYNLPEDLPERPQLFLKAPNTVASHRDTIPLPTPDTKIKNSNDLGEIETGKERIDYEAELGVVIDKQCKRVNEKNAPNYVKGFTCVNDLSNRDDQAQEHNWVRGKSFDNSAPIGPVITSPDLVPKNPRIKLKHNGKTKQDSAGDEFVFSVPEVMELIVLPTSLVASMVFSANLRTSSATTANPFPASPARAASIAAFKAKRLVWSAISFIISIT